MTRMEKISKILSVSWCCGFFCAECGGGIVQFHLVGGGGGVLPNISHIGVSAAPIGSVFTPRAPFWS